MTVKRSYLKMRKEKELLYALDLEDDRPYAVSAAGDGDAFLLKVGNWTTLHDKGSRKQLITDNLLSVTV